MAVYRSLRTRNGQLTPIGQLWLSAIVLFAATSLAMLAKPWLGEGYASLIFVVGIVVIGAVSGLAGAVATAVIGALAFNLFVVEPFYEFTFTSWVHFAPPFVFLVCAVVSGVLSGRLRDQTSRSRLANARLESLLNASRDLQPVRSPGELTAVLRGHLPGDDQLAITLHWLADHQPQADPLRADDGLPQPGRPARLRKEAITDGEVMLGELVYRPGIRPDDDIAFVTALARLSSLALTRLRLDAEVAETRALAKSEELKTALLSSVSHDLRTPLTTIGTAASSLLTFGDQIDEQTRRDLLSNIVDECDRLNHLTENLLQMSRLQAGSGHLTGNVLSAQDMIRRCIARLRTQSAAHTFVIKAPRDDMLVVADTALFELALTNVLQNAVKFSAEGSRITAACTAEDGDCVIAITDEGIGIAKPEQARVFERFHRVAGHAGGPAGSGLGLAIAKGFVEASGGTIALTSPVRDGHGTTITIHLPLASQESCA